MFFTPFPCIAPSLRGTASYPWPMPRSGIAARWRRPRRSGRTRWTFLKQTTSQLKYQLFKSKKFSFTLVVDDPVHSGLLCQADELGEVQALGKLDQVGLSRMPHFRTYFILSTNICNKYLVILRQPSRRAAGHHGSLNANKLVQKVQGFLSFLFGGNLTRSTRDFMFSSPRFPVVEYGAPKYSSFFLSFPAPVRAHFSSPLSGGRLEHNRIFVWRERGRGKCCTNGNQFWLHRLATATVK